MDDKSCLATTGSGQITFFKFYTEDIFGHLYFFPDFIRKPSGNILRCRENVPNKDNVPTKTSSIRTYSSDEKVKFGWISLTPYETTRLEAKTSDGKTASYTFATYQKNRPSPIPQMKKDKLPKIKRYYLKEASFSHKPTQTYEYEHPELTGPVLHPPHSIAQKPKSYPKAASKASNITNLGTMTLTK